MLTGDPERETSIRAVNEGRCPVPSQPMDNTRSGHVYFAFEASSSRRRTGGW